MIPERTFFVLIHAALFALSIKLVVSALY